MLRFSLVFASVATCLTAPAPLAASDLPPFEQVEQVVRRHFSAIEDYHPGDIISQSEVSPLFQQFKLMGFNSGDFHGVMARVPADDDFLVQALRTNRGRKFMHQVARFPMAYDRLDRLSGIPSGRKLVNDLIKTKGGYQMIEYMTTSRGGRNLGIQLSNVPHGEDFNKPTGKIYTEVQLVEALHKVYDEVAAQNAP